MVISMLEAQLNDEQSKRFLAEFRKFTSTPSQEHTPEKAFAIKQVEGNTWRLIGFWKDRKAFEDMRATMTPRGVVMMRAAGAEPTLTLYDVMDRMTLG